MQPITPPEILDPNRPLENTRGGFTADALPTEQLLASALEVSCDYARQLWDQLNEVREYLFGALPPDPRAPGSHVSLGASPTGPDDEEGWARWIGTFAAVNSVLCGPQGDSGYGLDLARHEAQLRRDAPNLPVLAALTTSAEQPAPATENGPAESQQKPDRASGSMGLRAVGKVAAAAAVTLLALRGLRPRARS